MTTETDAKHTHTESCPRRDAHRGRTSADDQGTMSR